MVSRRRNIIKNNGPLRKGSFKTKKPLKKSEINGNVPLSHEVNDRIIKTEDEVVKTFEQDFQISSQNTSIKMITKDKMNNNYVQINNCSRNSERLRKIVSRSSNNYISVPKKQSKRNTRSNVELNNSFNREKSTTESHQEGEEENNIAGKPVKSRRRKKLTEEDISERLRSISEKLKKSPEVFIEDEEEDERLEIEHKLMALNKDSGISFLDDYPDFDDRLKDEDEQMLGVVNSKTSGTIEGAHKPIIVTQKPDGQLHGCPNCSEVFLSELDLFRHKRETHRTPKIIMDTNVIKKFYDLPDRSKCPVCNKVLASTSKTIYIKHLQSHNSVGEFVCSVCKRVFKRKDHMRMHEKRHIV